MKKTIYTICAITLAAFCFGQNPYTMKSIQEYGVLPTNNPQLNRDNLQKAIDKAAVNGDALFIQPVAGGYPIDGGIVLKKSVSLIGVNGPVGRGSCAAGKVAPNAEPAGSVFRITDTEKPFITVESATQIRGVQFYYPNQNTYNPEKTIAYPPTILRAQNQVVEGVTLSCLTFFGEYTAMDFTSKSKACEQILIEHCYGYPLSGEFIKINRCTDIPRFLHCHVNPATMREFKTGYTPKVIDSVVAKRTYAFWLDSTDNAQLMDIHVFGVFGGIYMSERTYGQLTNFCLDCVAVGIYKDGNSDKCRQWMISQGSIISNTGASIEDAHPFIITGKGHTAITNVEAFSGGNGALTNHKASKDYMLIKGNDLLTVSLYGCRMRNYVADKPITIENPKAKVRAKDCINQQMEFFDLAVN